MSTSTVTLTGWGRIAPTAARLAEPGSDSDDAALLAASCCPPPG